METNTGLPLLPSSGSLQHILGRGVTSRFLIPITQLPVQEAKIQWICPWGWRLPSSDSSPTPYRTLAPHRLCPSSFSGWRFHSSQGLDKGKPERPEITTSTLLRWQRHSERGGYPQDQFQICCPGGDTGHKTALWLSPVWDTVWESSTLRILSETMVLVKSNKEETCSFTSDMSETTGQKVFQRETGKRWLRKSLWKQNKLQTGTSKTTPLKEPERTWISLWSNVCCKVLLETVEQSAIN